MKSIYPLPPLLDRKTINHYLRFFVLLLLLIYEAVSIIGLAFTPPIDLGVMMKARKVGKQKGILHCDRSNYRADICYMRGDIRTDSPSSSILIYNSDQETKEEIIRPYTRKWEGAIMKTIDEITLKPINKSGDSARACDIWHNIPGIMFSTGGYTGNLYHEFNDGLLPLYITSERLGGEVVMVVLEYHSWWMSKYTGVLKKLTNHKVVDFKRDNRVHCFSEMIVGLKIHDELTIIPSIGTNKTIWDFQALLGQGLLGFNPRQEKQLQLHNPPKKPKLVIFIRNKSRVLLNLKEIVKTSQKIGFEVQLLNPKRNTPLAEIYAILNSADAMLGVHGAAMTHFLFMRPGSVFIQIVPLGLSWPSEAYYGDPARKLGLEYMEYKIEAEESSLSMEYDQGNSVLVDPLTINRKGWSETKRIYLDKQNVRVNLKRFSKVLVKAHLHVLKLQSKEHGYSHT
ncbi:xylan glycosyltransferase MUCI21-like [Tasmannia lanceolata]|uniref:xylan glycosyltransferase MUCI21-like n=1 Tax=Tasmannia lanceolata TaxID=3420 RepID=UPI004063CCD8